jgi:hypothetical protein
MTAGRINQVSISTLSHRLGARSADVAISNPSIQPVSVRHDLQSVPTRKRPHAPQIALRMHQFCLIGSTARAFQSQRGRPPRFSRHFSLIASSIDVGPPRIEQHVEGDEQLMPPSSVVQRRRNLFHFLLATGKHIDNTSYIAYLSLVFRPNTTLTLNISPASVADSHFSIIGLMCIRKYQHVV